MAEDETYAREVGRRIVDARREMAMSQIELAELVHVSERSMQAYESGQVIPYRKLKDLAGVLNRPMSWILHGDAAQPSTGELAPTLEKIAGLLEEIRDAVVDRPRLSAVQK